MMFPERIRFAGLAGAHPVEAYDSVYATGLEETTAPFALALRSRDDQLSQRWFRQTLKPWRARDREMRGLIVTTLDITEEVRAREEAERRKADLAFALDVGQGVGTWDWDVRRDRLTVNERFAQLYAVPAAERDGQRPALLVEKAAAARRHPADRAIRIADAVILPVVGPSGYCGGDRLLDPLPVFRHDRCNETGKRLDLASLVREEMVACAAQENAYKIEGPDVALSPLHAEVMTLVIHELAANSLKYGALGDQGFIKIGWTLVEKESTMLQLRWQETGLSVADAPDRQGFGRRLIEERIAYELGGSGVLIVHDTGVLAEIDFPLEDRGSVLETGTPSLEQQRDGDRF